MRHQAIDTILRKSGNLGVTIEEICLFCAEFMKEKYGDSIISIDTIRKDIKELREGKIYNKKAPIKNQKARNGEGLAGKYYYEDSQFSLFNSPFSEKEMEVLKEGLLLLRQHKGDRFIQRNKRLIDKFDRSISYKEHFVSFEAVPETTGLGYFDEIYNAIKHKQVLDIVYRSYQGTVTKSYENHPYYLKEYNNRWYFFGLGYNAQYSRWQIFVMGLDRIRQKPTILDKEYKENTIFYPSNYFKNIIGVSKGRDETIYNIILSFTPTRGEYVLSKKIHLTQKTLIKNKEEIRISLELMINKELIREVLSFREDVKVIEPSILKEHILAICSNIRVIYS